MGTTLGTWRLRHDPASPTVEVGPARHRHALLGDSTYSSPRAASYRGGVTRLLVVGGVLVALWAVSCLVMMLLAHRLPPGLLRQVAEFLPSCVTAARQLRAHPDVPRRAKVALLVAVVWVVSPI